jgi:uncharacterized phage protein gp47/JayE
MAYQTQTTAQINATLISALEAQFGQTIPIFGKAFARVLCWVLSGVFALLWRYAGWIFLQLFVRYATADEVTVGTKRIRPLVEWGRWIGVGDPELAKRAELVIAVDVTTQIGTLPAGSKLLRSSTGVVYTVTYPVELDAATINATIRAVSDQEGGDGSGEIGNLEASDVVSFMQPIPNVNRDAEVVSIAKAGVDAEDIETSYRPKVLDAYQNRPQGGALVDYRTWGKTVSGIVNVYPYKSDAPGEMDIYVETTATEANPDGIPSAEQLTAVEDAIIYDDDGLASRMPAGVEHLNVYAITRKGYDVDIGGLTPDTTEARDGIEAALTEHFLTREPFILGLSRLPRVDRILKVDLGGIASTVAASHGAIFTAITLRQNGSVDAIDTAALDHGEKSKLVTLTFE